jgi:ribonuclease HI
MSCFDLTKGLCDELSTIIGRYWWSQQDKVNKIHWLSWEKLTRSKKKGGLGFRDLHLFNLAMLSRQAWRLLTNPNTLCGQVLKAKYFPRSNILHCTPRYGTSYTWRSILRGVELLKEEIIWRIGNGESVRIWEDPWLPKGDTRKPITPKGACLLTKVNELINPVTGEWDEQLIHDIFWPEDAAEILRITIDEQMEDWPAWHFDAKGLFLVKSAYKLAVQQRDNSTRQDASSSRKEASEMGQFNWFKIWKLKVPNKVKMFMWRLAHNILPVRRNVARRGVMLDTIYPICKRLDEDCGHIFFKCKYVKQCWRFMNMEDVRSDLMKCQSGIETINKIWELDKSKQLKVIVFLWRWWSVRNKVSDVGRLQCTTEIQSSVTFFLLEFEKLEIEAKKVRSPVIPSWKPPPRNFYKINTDGAYDHNTRSRGWGFVVRDKKGVALLVGAGKVMHAASAIQTEALAAFMVIQQAVQLGMTHIILETDASVLASALCSIGVDRSAIGCLVRQTQELMQTELSSCIVSLCNRSCNKVVDCLATYGAFTESCSCS